MDTNTVIDMPYSINGVSVNNISKMNNYVMQGQNRINGVSINVCLEYTFENPNPPFPPSPDITFNYTDCAGNPQTIDVSAGSGPTVVCAILDSASSGPGGNINTGNPCG